MTKQPHPAVLRAAEAVLNEVRVDVSRTVGMPRISHIFERETCYSELVEAFREAIEEIQLAHIDWSLFNSESPDFDPQYKPTFPAIVNKASALLDRIEKGE